MTKAKFDRFDAIANVLRKVPEIRGALLEAVTADRRLVALEYLLRMPRRGAGRPRNPPIDALEGALFSMIRAAFNGSHADLSPNERKAVERAKKLSNAEQRPGRKPRPDFWMAWAVSEVLGREHTPEDDARFLRRLRRHQKEASGRIAKLSALMDEADERAEKAPR